MLNNISVLLFITLLGYIFSFFDKLKNETERSLNKYLYYIALPSLIITKTININIKTLNYNFLLLNIIPILIIQLFIFLLYKINLFSSLFARTLIIIATLGNTVYLGFPVVSLIVGEEYISFAALSSSIQNITVFIFGIIIINIIEESESINAIKKILKNPLIISSFIPIILISLSIKIPSFIIEPLKEIGKTTFGVSLFVIGMSMKGKNLKGESFFNLFISFFLKMILLPAISILIVFFFDMQEKSDLVSVINYTMPNAVACYAVTYEMNLNYSFTSKSIFFTTIIYFILFYFYNNMLFKIF